MTTGKAILRALGVIAAVILTVVVGWLAFGTRMNLGPLLQRLMGGTKRARKPVPAGTGIAVGIVADRSPLRDKGQVTLADGEVIELPKGVQDIDVRAVVKVETGEYRVETSSTRLTDRFGRR